MMSGLDTKVAQVQVTEQGPHQWSLSSMDVLSSVGKHIPCLHEHCSASITQALKKTSSKASQETCYPGEG